MIRFFRCGPRRITHPDGTVQTVFAGPSKTPRWRRYVIRLVVDFATAVAIVVVAIGGAVLALEYGSLSVASRLWCGGMLVAVLLLWALVRYGRRRKMGS